MLAAHPVRLYLNMMTLSGRGVTQAKRESARSLSWISMAAWIEESAALVSILRQMACQLLRSPAKNL
jgi:predicted component of type VI protein secretion system